MRIGELARRTATPAGTIRYYESIGLLPAVGRKSTGYRDFGPEHVRVLRFIRSARGLRLSLDQIREILDAASHDRSPCDCARHTIQQSVKRIDERINDLRSIRAGLIDTLRLTEGSASAEMLSLDPICPAIESASTMTSIEPLDSPVDWKL